MNLRSHPIIIQLSSLKLSVVILAFSLALVFFGTLDQVQYGIRETQKLYFESFIAFWKYPQIWPRYEYLQWLTIPLPGGYLLGPLFAFNMGASLMRLASWKPRKFGIVLIHLGILILIIGQLITQIWQTDSYLWLDEGESKSYIERFYEDEIVLTQRSEGKIIVVSINPEYLANKETLALKEPFPFTLVTKAYYPNAAIQSKPQPMGVTANRGVGHEFSLQATPVDPNYTGNTRNATTAILEIKAPDQSLGTWMISNLFQTRFAPQEFTYNGSTYTIECRPKREQLPFSIELETFHHDKYPGTEIPKNFASDVVVYDSKSGESRKATISMNNPLRYGGKTFFQASFAKQDTASMFQVVENPGWLIPYISCILVSLGLIYQFLYSSIHYMRQRK